MTTKIKERNTKKFKSLDDLKILSEETLIDVLDNPSNKDVYIPLKKIPIHLLEDRRILLGLCNRTIDLSHYFYLT